MKIGASVFQPVMLEANKKSEEDQTELSPIQQFEKSKQALKEMAQRKVSEMEEARTDMGEDDPKAQRLIEKFNSGKKLTPEEMAYVRKNAPGMMNVIDRIMREREMIEISMRQAPSKTDVQMVVYRASKRIEKDPSAEMRELRAKHLADAKHEYEQTDEYKDKPNSPLDKEERPIRVKYKKNQKQYVPVSLESYKKASGEKGKISSQFNVNI